MKNDKLDNMGNNHSTKKANSSPERLIDEAVYKQLLSKNKCQLEKNDVEAIWCKNADRTLVDVIADFLFPFGQSLDFETYHDFATSVTIGSFEKRTEIILKLIAAKETISQAHHLKQLILAVLKSVIHVEFLLPKKLIKSWSDNGESTNFDRLVNYYLSFAGGEKTAYSSKDINSLLPEIDVFLSCVFNRMLRNESHVNSSSFFPRWLRLKGDVGKGLEKCTMIDLDDVLFLNQLLPIDYQLEWRLLFSTKIHGESFSRLSGQIINQGATLLIIQDKDGFVFGGFAPDSWNLNPKFVGNSSSFIFSLRPQINVFPASNFNENFQYLNQGQQTLPNGLGMGGRLEYFGLWLDSEFGKGIFNDSCTTYRNFRKLSKEKEFSCADVEVWGVGKPPPTAAELGERSVLDGNSEARALLELAGKKTYSDGLREEAKE